jgi:hypothetical protein
LKFLGDSIGCVEQAALEADEYSSYSDYLFRSFQSAALKPLYLILSPLYIPFWQSHDFERLEDL